MFGLLGPNGSGKSTFFRILSTSLRPAQGSVRIDGFDTAQEADAVRRRLGVVFQSPSLDPKLTVGENLHFHGWLFGLRGPALRRRSAELLDGFSLAARRGERVETLSGGLKRRVELAKALLPAPPLLLLDEPSTGLDPAARLDFWNVLAELRARTGLTIIVATHLMDEAERCDRVALLDQGRLVAEGDPESLRREVGGDVLTVEAAHPEALARSIRERFRAGTVTANGRLRIETDDGLGMAARLLESFGGEIRSLTLGKPTLEDVFLARTGRALDSDAASVDSSGELP
jgi:ABC-2 type transport system ATP-binding protein